MEGVLKRANIKEIMLKVNTFFKNPDYLNLVND
jgi:hypothetical protein